jgi:hypothetical protein
VKGLTVEAAERVIQKKLEEVFSPSYDAAWDSAVIFLRRVT